MHTKKIICDEVFKQNKPKEDSSFLFTKGILEVIVFLVARCADAHCSCHTQSAK